MRKAITPVISVTLLIFITLVAGVGAYAWFSTIQSELQEGISGSVESFPGSSCSQLNLIAMRGDGVVISNVGCDTVGSVNVFIDGVLTSYDLLEPLEPGQATTISYTALSANQSHTLQIVLDNGKIVSESVDAFEATSEAGFTGGEEAPEGFTCEESSCSTPYIMFEGTITDSLNNGCPCCGDDNLDDIFYNSTHYCSYGGVIFNADALYTQDWYGDRIDYSSGKGVCELEGYAWFEDAATTFSGSSNYAVGSNPYGVAVGDLDGDGDLDVVTANHIGDGTFSVRFNDYLSGTNGPCCGDDGATDDFSNSTHQCVNGVFSEI